MRHFDPIKRECSYCGLLCTPEAFKYHETKICEVIKFKNKILEEELKGYGEFKNKGAGI